jgi:hypothetical protein
VAQYVGPRVVAQRYLLEADHGANYPLF